MISDNFNLNLKGCYSKTVHFKLQKLPGAYFNLFSDVDTLCKKNIESQVVH